MVLPLPFAPTRPTRMPAVMVKVRLSNRRLVFESEPDFFQMDQALGLLAGGDEIEIGVRRAASGLEIGQFGDQLAGVVDARFGLGRARLGTAPQPLHFDAHAVLEGALALGLGVQELDLLFQEGAVVAGDIEHPVGIDAVQLGHSGRARFRESSDRG